MVQARGYPARVVLEDRHHFLSSNGLLVPLHDALSPERPLLFIFYRFGRFAASVAGKEVMRSVGGAGSLARQMRDFVSFQDLGTFG